jgi:glycosyltransferase domain-containing protein
MQKSLTILLPLKGRPLHTLRFLWHADRERFPYKFLIADGQVHSAIAKILENAAGTFPNLDIEYVRYPDDVNFSRFYQKMADACARVRTPYLMQVDNDDFLVRSGIDRCVEFLETHPDFASYGGGIGGFALDEPTIPAFAQVSGRLWRLSYRYLANYIARDISDPSAAERIRKAFWCPPLYYNVFRTEALRTINSEIAELDFSDLELHEVYFCARALSLGKCRMDRSVVSYLRQKGTSMDLSMAGKDWAYHLLRNRFSSDFQAMVNRIVSVVSGAENVDPIAFAEEVRELYADKLRSDLHARYGRRKRKSSDSRAKRFLKQNFPELTGRLQRLRSRWRAFRRRNGLTADREEFVNQLRTDGASEDYIAIYNRELSTVVDAVDNPEFIAFVRKSAPALLLANDPITGSRALAA